MAVIVAAQEGNWSDPNTWVGGVVPGDGDDAFPGEFTITIDEDITCAALRVDSIGFFSAAEGVTINADIYADSSDSGNTMALAVSTNNVTVNGTCYGCDAGPGSGLINFPVAIWGIPTGAIGLRIKATVAGARGMPPIAACFSYIDSSTASAKVRATSGLTEITLRTKAFAGVLPAESDVKSGTVYGGGDYTGYLSGSSTRAGQLLMTAPMSGSNAASAGAGSMPTSILLDDSDTPLIADDDGYTLTTED